MKKYGKDIKSDQLDVLDIDAWLSKLSYILPTQMEFNHNDTINEVKF